MGRAVKKPIEIEFHQWFKMGDHPKVRPYDAISKDQECRKCGYELRFHGWLDTLEGGHIVCPADMIITGVEGEHYPCKPGIFAKTYDVIETE